MIAPIVMASTFLFRKARLTYALAISTMPNMDPGTKLREFRLGLGLSQRRAAKQLRVSNTLLGQWELGSAVPTALYRAAIARWTGGRVGESEWGLTPQEAAASALLAEVGPATK